MNKGQKIAQNVQLMTAIKQWELTGRTEAPAVMDKKDLERVEARWNQMKHRTSAQKRGFYF